MNCNACGAPYHPATGHRFSDTTRLCGGCAKDMVKWTKRQMSRRSGKLRFYDYAISRNEGEALMESWHSYPKVYNIGHAYLEELLLDPVIVEEKVDGSQFSFGKFGDKLMVRSKGRVFDVEHPDNMFAKASSTVLSLADKLVDGWTYRGEYLQKPRHNGLAYDRTPDLWIILFDINTGEEKYLTRRDKELEASRLGLEIVPILYEGKVDSANTLTDLLNKQSVLGGQLIEGFVIKNYVRFGRDGKVLMGKHVSENFKEIQQKHWTKDNPKGGDIVEDLCKAYRTEARWQKAVQHLRDDGVLQVTPQDIGPLIKEVHRDLDDECAEEIKAVLYKWARKKIVRNVCRGLPEWYKTKLLEGQFEKGSDDDATQAEC